MGGQLVQPGSSSGGAIPKASVIDTDKTLYVAKFPSRKDDYDTGLWEHFSHLLAIKAGINAAKTKVLARMDVTECLLSTKVVVFVEFLWFMMEFCKEISRLFHLKML